MAALSLTQIYLYPVKSLGGISVQHWPVDGKGLLYDRKWMLVDENNRFLSQRRLPNMALIKTRISADELILSTPEQQQFALPLQPDAGDPLEVDIWHDRCLARAVSREADRWLTDFLDAPCRLVYQPEDGVRRVDPKYAEPSDQTRFADGFPFLITSSASLHSLNEAMEHELPMTRFRPNLVIGGCSAYAEDCWREIAINGIHFRLPKPCSRCNVPAIDQDTAETGKEPLLTLKHLRRWNNQIYFGQNALHDGPGELTVGDSMQIISTGARQPPLPAIG
ncbi:MOSC N-terminal beta barrel domain-containing protein [Methylomarinum sp. Ch1-1]|uniref:MOSC N-terminal beta barrel domain-containing protein n=1 Tax=Methylomarinum roseum TaxID=3067653 RepID=A0AAU7NTG3_9GAMM|nr:MOSC N-terminal beta barrel domain-containing protein [Methylomarinum sp. Ch1-1]MDP4519639.1 MOSC domain-containing protein [Methylomarinum sp. Ch1-1]